MRIIVWGDPFWIVNICAALALTIAAGDFADSKIQLGEYLQISGLWVGVFFFAVVPLTLGSSAYWAHRISMNTGGPRS